MTTVPDSRRIDEVILVVRPRELPQPEPRGAVRDAWQAGRSGVLGLLAVTSQVGAATAQAAVAVGQSAVQAALDRVVPAAVSAVVTRIDRVDLTPIIERVLDSIDLTAIVRDRVDVDAIADRIDIDRIIDRIPLVDLANYVVDEIDLTRIIRESTGGIAVDSINAVRFQSLNADDKIAAIVDALLRRRRPRSTSVSTGPDTREPLAAMET